MPFGNVAWSWVQFVKSRLGDQNLKLFLESAFAFFLMIALSVAADQVHEVESLATSDNFRIRCSQGGPPPKKYSTIASRCGDNWGSYGGILKSFLLGAQFVKFSYITAGLLIFKLLDR